MKRISMSLHLNNEIIQNGLHVFRNIHFKNADIWHRYCNFHSSVSEITTGIRVITYIEFSVGDEFTDNDFYTILHEIQQHTYPNLKLISHTVGKYDDIHVNYNLLGLGA